MRLEGMNVRRAMTVSIPVDDFEKLQVLAANDQRRPRDEAGILLSSILSTTDVNGSWMPLPAIARLRRVESAAREVARLGNQPGFDDEEWEQAINALEEALR